MYVQIVTYNLNGVSEQDYIDIAHQVAPQFASMEGLHAKVWLQNADTNSYGAVYFWENREAQERFAASDLFEATYPGFANVVADAYAVNDSLTRATQPLLRVFEEEGLGWAPPPPPPIEPAVEVVEEADELPEEPELPELAEDELYEDEDELYEDELYEDELEEELEPVVVKAARKVVKRSPKKAAPTRTVRATRPTRPAKAAKPIKRAKPTRVVKVVKKAAPARRTTSVRTSAVRVPAPRVSKVTRVTKTTKKAGRPAKVTAKRAKRSR